MDLLFSVIHHLLIIHYWNVCFRLNFFPFIESLNVITIISKPLVFKVWFKNPWGESLRPFQEVLEVKTIFMIIWTLLAFFTTLTFVLKSEKQWWVKTVGALEEIKTPNCTSSYCVCPLHALVFFLKKAISPKPVFVEGVKIINFIKSRPLSTYVFDIPFEEMANRQVHTKNFCCMPK